MNRQDDAFIKSMLPAIESVLAWHEQRLAPNGLNAPWNGGILWTGPSGTQITKRPEVFRPVRVGGEQSQYQVVGLGYGLNPKSADRQSWSHEVNRQGLSIEPLN